MYTRVEIHSAIAGIGEGTDFGRAVNLLHGVN